MCRFPLAKMGKKSKRRGGTGGGRKIRQTVGAGDVGGSPRLAGDQLAAAAAPGAAGLHTPADAVALLETVQPPPSLKGIVSTNDDPGKCAMCLSPAGLGFSSVGANFVPEWAACHLCCGKRVCRACDEHNFGFALDLLGGHRCTFCNAKVGDEVLVKASSGTPWAQYFNGLSFCVFGDSPNQAFDYMVKAASQGHPEAVLMLCELCRGQFGHPRDLMAAQIFAKKARSFHPDLRLNSNMRLLNIAKEYLEDGAVEEVMGILSDVAKETDPNALDGELCKGVAVFAYRIQQYQFSGEMFARAFYHGIIQSAFHASDCYTRTEHYALCKLWLSVACKTSSDFRCFMMKGDDGTIVPLSWSFFKPRRDAIRSELREIRDSCGGCGTALEGDMRKYCRGCKAFCYCGRDCQKMHWNRADGGHRAECKEAQDQACKILEAIQSGKIDLSKKNDDE